MYYINKVQDIRDAFIYKYQVGDFSIDKTGQKTIELLSANFIADEPAIFGTPNQHYINAEIEWYESQSTNINDIYGGQKEPPKAWKYTADKHGNINSNYGTLIFSDKYHNQYNHVLNELKKNPFSRRGTMVYNRPSIWAEYNENGKNDFICTGSVSYYIRENKLNCVVQMRSNDIIFGYRNDYAWQKYVLNKLCNELKLPIGNIYWQVQNLHLYEKHFHLIKSYK